LPQGLLLLDLNQTARLPEQSGKPLVYIQYVETAPWNSPRYSNPIRYRGVGSTLIRAAVELSLDSEFRGRLGLHSLPEAESFYREKVGMTEMEPDVSQQGLRYFEATETQALAFVDRTGGQYAA